MKNLTQKDFLSQLSKSNPEAVIIGSIGTISYDLSEIFHMRKVLIRGAMGATLGCALGYAMASQKEVIAVIGDGSFLMKQGSLSTILRYAPKNLRVIILNNDKYKSCGGQATNFRFIRETLPASVQVYDVE